MAIGNTVLCAVAPLSYLLTYSYRFVYLPKINLLQRMRLLLNSKDREKQFGTTPHWEHHNPGIDRFRRNFWRLVPRRRWLQKRQRSTRHLLVIPLCCALFLLVEELWKLCCTVSESIRVLILPVTRAFINGWPTILQFMKSAPFYHGNNKNNNDKDKDKEMITITITFTIR